MLPIRTILHPTDFSGRSEDAFRAACSLARDHNSRVVVLYVRAPATVAYGEVGPVVEDPVGTPEDVRLRLAARLDLDPGLDIEYRVADGDPAEEVVSEARVLGADLIVMGTHGRTGLSRLLMGSVAEAVLRRAPCPVLTLKAPFLAGPEEEVATAGELART